MAHGPQVSPPIEYAPRIFSAAPQAPASAAVSVPTVLLVGRSGSWATPVLRSLEKFHSEVFHTPPAALTATYARGGNYRLILLDSTVSPEQRRALVSELAGTEASIFYTLPVEHGCWWLPALRRGQNCHGEPAFRRSEFPFELERVLQEPTQA